MNIFLTQQNGLRAISPATISILIFLISRWDCEESLRRSALNCFAIMTHVLQKTSPDLRQIDLLTIFQMYINAMEDLLKTDHFKTKVTSESFQIGEDDDNKSGSSIDVNALNAVIGNIMAFVTEQGNKNVVCIAILEAKFVPMLVTIPEAVKVSSCLKSGICIIYIFRRTKKASQSISCN